MRLTKLLNAEGKRLDLNMTSMIDMVFLLLIFFMVTMQDVAPEQMIETDLQLASGAGPNPDDLPPPETEFAPSLLQIRLEGAKVVRTLDARVIYSDDHLRDCLRDLKKWHADTRVCVRCDDQVPYDWLVRSMGCAQAAQVGVAFGRNKNFPTK